MACAEIERVTLPDPYDMGESYRGFAPSSLVAGRPNQGLRVTGRIGNSGAVQSGFFLIQIYASADDQITSDDYLLGTIGADVSIRGTVTISWSGTLPTDIPAGAYHIGWLIDPDDDLKEADENNNTAVVEAGVLTVLSP